MSGLFCATTDPAAAAAGKVLSELPAASWMPRSCALHPVVKMLIRARDLWGQEMPLNLIQTAFVERYMPAFSDDAEERYVAERAFCESFNDNELMACASKNVEEVNELLEEKGFALRLVKQAEGTCYFASTLNISFQWEKKGAQVPMEVAGITYDAVQKSVKAGNVFFMGEHEHPIFEIRTRGRDVVYMTKATSLDLTNFGLLEISRSLTPMHYWERRNCSNDYILTFPMVDSTEISSIEWLRWMSYRGGEEVTEALQETTFKMDEKGASVRSAAAMYTAAGCAYGEPKPPIYYEMNEPFWLWVTRPGLAVPYFALYCTPDIWTNPNSSGRK